MADFLPGSIAPFAGIAWWAIVGVFAAHAFGSFIRGAFGFGSNMPIVLITTFLLGPHHAILLALITTAMAQVTLAKQGWETADWQVARPLVAGLVIGTGAGTWLFTILSAEWLTLTLGILLCVIVAMDSLHVVERLTTRIDMRSKGLTTGFALVGGTMGGISGGGAFYFLVVYMKHACKTAAALRGTNVMLSMVAMIIRVIVVLVAGRLTTTLLAEGLLLAPVVFAATWAGSRFYRTGTSQRFYLGIQILLFAGALALIAKGIGRIS